MNYLLERLKNIVKVICLFLTDYINLLHGQFMLPGMYRRDVVLYNPKKGIKYIEALQKEITEVQWKAISNMNLEIP